MDPARHGRFVETDAGGAWCTVEGTGPWVALSHSLACDASMWDAQAERLRRRFTVLRYDLRGHGRSECRTAPAALEDLGADLLRILDAFGVDAAALVGLSLGGLVAQHLAATAPERVSRLVLAGTTAVYPESLRSLWSGRIGTARRDGLEPLVEPTLERWFTRGFREREPATVARIAASIRATSREGYAGCCAVLAAVDMRPMLGAIRCPTLVIVGEQDAGTPPAMAEALAAGIAGARLHVVPDAAHLCCVERPDAFADALDAFLP